MKPLTILPVFLFLTTALLHAEDRWKTIDEGFRVTVPWSWQKQKIQPIDSNCGAYKADTIDLEFDEVFGLGYTSEEAQSRVDELKTKEANPKLLKLGEEIWRVDGRIASFSNGKVDPKVYGQRRFTNVARLHVPYEGEPGYLSIYILYKSDDDAPTVRRVLKSIKWKRKPDPTT